MKEYNFALFTKLPIKSYSAPSVYKELMMMLIVKSIEQIIVISTQAKDIVPCVNQTTT